MKFRCISEPVRLQRVTRLLEKRYTARCVGYCDAERRHVASDMAECRKYIKAGRCDEASIVLDHLELIARKR